MTTPLNDAMPDEVVTHSRVATFEMPHGAGRMALITIDNDRDHKRPTTFGPQGLASLDAALDDIVSMSGITAVAVTGKPYFFAVGADLSGIGSIQTRELALEIAQLGHAVFRRLGELDVPSFAFVNGAAMGGGLELALHCTYRTVSSGAAALSLPETFLGLIPGWGGAWLLPNLIGPQDAMQVMLTNALSQNKQMRPKDALKLGVVDAQFDAADFLEQSIDWAARVVSGQVTVKRSQPERGMWDMVVQFARGQLDSRLHGAFPAPYLALDLVAGAKSASRDEGFAAEDEALAQLIMTDELRASLYAFDLVQKRARKPVGVPDASLARPVTKIGLVGAGLMASQLALLFAQRLEVPIVMTDIDEARLEKATAYIAAEVAKLQEKGRMSNDRANRVRALITTSLSKDAFADADFVIEAVFEQMDVKRQVFAEVEAVVSPECIMATNTSSLSVTAMAEGLRHPERVVGFHFFNPVAVMPLLEIAAGSATDDVTVSTAFVLAKKLKKSAVRTKDAPAFVVNRLLLSMLNAVFEAIDEGTDLQVADRALRPMGLPMAPLTLLQLVGPAVALHVLQTLHDAFPDRYTVSPGLTAVVKAGKPGFLVPGSKPAVLDPEVVSLLSQGDVALNEEQVLDRVLDAMAREARLMLDEGVVAAPEDIDLCMILGAGLPFAAGGITPLLDRQGASERAAGGRFLPPGVASLPSSV